MRITGSTMKVLDMFLKNFNSEVSGAEITKKTGLMSGTLYPILRRLEKHGWLSSYWEEIDPSQAGRPRRRLYTLNGSAHREIYDALAKRGFYKNNPMPNLSAVGGLLG